MLTSGSTRLIREINTQHVLNLVRLNPGITAREISRITSLQISTVLYTLQSLQNKGLVRKSGLGPTTRKGGKPPMTWAIDGTFGQIIGVELLSREIRLVVLGFDTKIIHEMQFRFEGKRSPEQFIRLVKKAVSKAMPDSSTILGMGIGIPGFVNTESGIALHSALFETQSVPFGSILKNNFPFPVHLDNTANCGALSAKWLDPETREESHIAYISVNQNFSGMGVGFIINHELYRGSRNAAGEIRSFLSPEERDRFVREARAVCPPDCFLGKELSPDQISLGEIIREARQKNPAGEMILERITENIAHRLQGLIEVFDPGVVVIGGDICSAQSLIEPVLKESFSRQAIGYPASDPSILYSPFGTYAVAMGSTVLVFEKYFRFK
jgi:predicted NBD/HSP70 family sugar kinase